MRIDDNTLSRISSPASGASQKLRRAQERSLSSAGASQAGASGDEVQFSSVAGHVSAENLSVKQSLMAERSTRVEELTQLVQSGKYRPDPHKIADSMIRNMLAGSASS